MLKYTQISTTMPIKSDDIDNELPSIYFKLIPRGTIESSEIVISTAISPIDTFIAPTVGEANVYVVPELYIDYNCGMVWYNVIFSPLDLLIEISRLWKYVNQHQISIIPDSKDPGIDLD